MGLLTGGEDLDVLCHGAQRVRGGLWRGLDDQLFGEAINPHRTVVDFLKNVPPCAPDPAPCESVTPKAKADTILEVNAGVADAQGAVPGAKLKWVGIP